MARKDNKSEELVDEAPKQEIVVAAKIELPEPSEDKIKFLVWFSKALESWKQMKPHHMNAIQAFFKNIGLSDSETPSTYEDGLKKFGYRRSK